MKVIAGEVVWSWCGISDIMDLAVSGDIQILASATPILFMWRPLLVLMMRLPC